MTDSSTRWRGIFPACLTMFTAEGTIDETGTQGHVEYLIRSGVHGMVACGTSGEFIAMTNDERMRVVRIILDATAGRVPVLAGTGHYSTRLTIEMSQAAERAGADGLLVILPYFQRPPKASILNHYRELRRHTTLPIWVYNNPLYAACDPMSTVEIAQLHAEGVVDGVKSTLDSVVPIHELLTMCGDNFHTFYGTFQAPLEALLTGAHGWISGFPNFLAAQSVALYEAASRGAIEPARRLWAKMMPFKQLYSHQHLGPVNDLAIYRAGLDLLGEHGGFSRKPFAPLNDDQRRQLRDLMVKEGLLS